MLIPDIRSPVYDLVDFGVHIGFNPTHDHSEFHGYQYSPVDIATGYWLDDGGLKVRVPEGSRFFLPSRSPDGLSNPSSLLSNGYQGPFL